MKSVGLLMGVLLTLAACESAPSKFGPGLHLQLRVEGGQLHHGGLGDDRGGPEVSQVSRPQIEVRRGEAGVKLNGRLAPGGVALHVQAVGDADHWVLPAKGFDFVVADELQYSASLEFSHAVQRDELRVRLQASDASGRLGPVTETSFAILPEVPPARLLVSLAWDAPVDLDLHLVDGNGVLIGSKNINSYEAPPGPLPPPDAWMEGGFLDYDSNQQCELDLRNRENIMWLNADPPPGRYKIYAHLFSPCDQSTVNMVAVVLENGELLLRAGATQYDFDSRIHPSGEQAPGLLLGEFDLP